MLAKVFEGKPRAIENNLNDWLADVKPMVKDLSATAYKSGVMYVVVLYDEPRKPQERVRGQEKPGEAPACTCGRTMTRRLRGSDQKPFWGCSGFPECKGVKSFDEADEEAERKRTSPDEPEFGGKGGYYDPDGSDIPF